jgi:hypothetical protein
VIPPLPDEVIPRHLKLTPDFNIASRRLFWKLVQKEKPRDSLKISIYHFFTSLDRRRFRN